MGRFKELMKQDLVIRGFSERTVYAYMHSMENFVRFFKVHSCFSCNLGFSSPQC